MSRSSIMTRRLFGVALLAVTCAPAAASAQSDISAINANVTVQSTAINLVPISDLEFGSHFAAEGAVQNETAGHWGVTVADGTTVDFFFSALPDQLTDANGQAAVPLSYGAQSLAATCGQGGQGAVLVFGSPTAGISGCQPGGGNNPGEGSVFLGGDAQLGLSEFVTVDLTGAEPGAYTGVIELTAVIN